VQHARAGNTVAPVFGDDDFQFNGAVQCPAQEDVAKLLDQLPLGEVFRQFIGPGADDGLFQAQDVLNAVALLPAFNQFGNVVERVAALQQAADDAQAREVGLAVDALAATALGDGISPVPGRRGCCAPSCRFPAQAGRSRIRPVVCVLPLAIGSLVSIILNAAF